MSSPGSYSTDPEGVIFRCRCRKGGVIQGNTVHAILCECAVFHFLDYSFFALATDHSQHMHMSTHRLCCVTYSWEVYDILGMHMPQAHINTLRNNPKSILTTSHPDTKINKHSPVVVEYSCPQCRLPICRQTRIDPMTHCLTVDVYCLLWEMAVTSKSSQGNEDLNESGAMHAYVRVSRHYRTSPLREPSCEPFLWLFSTSHMLW